MRALILLAVLAAPASAGVSVGETLYPGSAGYLGQDLRGDWTSASGRYRLGARVKTFRRPASFRGTRKEYSASFERRLPHVTVAGRLGTAPPDAERASYHLAGGEAALTWYGLSLGPSVLADAATVSEDTTTAAELAGFDETWVTGFRARFTSANHRQEPTARGTLGTSLVQNTWQFSVSETWRKDTRLTLSGGGDRYNKTVSKGTPSWFLWNIDYPGAPVAVRGWTNNHFGVELERSFGAFGARAGFTRINMVAADAQTLAGGEVRWARAPKGPEARLGWYRRSRRAESDSVLALGGSWRW